MLKWINQLSTRDAHWFTERCTWPPWPRDGTGTVRTWRSPSNKSMPPPSRNSCSDDICYIKCMFRCILVLKLRNPKSNLDITNYLIYVNSRFQVCTLGRYFAPIHRSKSLILILILYMEVLWQCLPADWSLFPSPSAKVLHLHLVQVNSNEISLLHYSTTVKSYIFQILLNAK